MYVVATVSSHPVDTERKLNLHKTSYVRSIYILCLRGGITVNFTDASHMKQLIKHKQRFTLGYLSWRFFFITHHFNSFNAIVIFIIISTLLTTNVFFNNSLQECLLPSNLVKVIERASDACFCV